MPKQPIKGCLCGDDGIGSNCYLTKHGRCEWCGWNVYVHRKRTHKVQEREVGLKTGILGGDQLMCDEYCTGCFYLTKNSNLGYVCDYMLITDHRRPCNSGKECTVRMITKERIRGVDQRRAAWIRSRTR